MCFTEGSILVVEPDASGIANYHYYASVLYLCTETLKLAL